MDGIVKCVAVAVLLLAPLCMAACGRDEPKPTAEVPAWAKVAPEQIAEAKKHGVPVAFENDLGMRFVLIPAGTFTLGSLVEVSAYDDESPHEVKLTKPFYVQATEVTNKQYRRWKSDHDSGTLVDTVLNEDDQPVVNVSWTDASTFASWLTQREPKRAYRLPTEAEWEYACRAGTTTHFAFGDAITTSQVNYDGVYTSELGSKGLARRTAVRVGTFPPNGWGLHEMHGNVREWCRNVVYDYPASPQVDPSEPEDGELRAVRGGSWWVQVKYARSASRGHLEPEGLGHDHGFRLVSPLPESGK